jgi:hypothetical protein
MTLYFAYGSHMDRSAMKRRCPGARAVGPGVLEGYRFFVGVDGWGSVRASRGDAVHGVLWRLTPRDIAVLHAYELLHQGLASGICRFTMDRGFGAMVYLLRRRAIGMARPGYIALIATAARHWNLPESYVRSVQRWSTSRYTGARIIDRECVRE